MVSAIQTAQYDSVEIYFKKLIPLISNNEIDDISLNLIYTYASFLEKTGKGDQAALYYKFLIENSNSNYSINLLSEIGLASNLSNLKKVKELSEKVKEVVLNGEIEDDNTKIGLIIRMSNAMHLSEQYDFLKSFKGLEDGEASPENIQAILLMFNYVFSGESDGDYPEINKKLERCFESQNDDRFLVDEYMFRLKDALAKGSYSNALEYSKKAVGCSYGPVESVEDLIKLAEESDKGDIRSILRYAHCNLYQTRLGKGIKPVEESLALYSGALNVVLKKKNDSLKRLASRKIDLLGVEFIDILVVGTYLYQQTGDVEYLNSSVSVVDEFYGLGIHYWLSARDRMREDEAFEEAVNDLKKSNRLDLSFKNGHSLEEIYERIRIHSNANDESLSDRSFNSISLTSGKEISLQSTQFQAAQDSSSILSFYQNGNVLYRLLLTGDTIAVDILNGVRTEAMTLATSLSAEVQIPNQGEGLDKNSRRLFELLFGDIEELLPKRVSIIAGGVLTEIPFSALRMEQAGEKARYFGVEHAISRQFSIRSKQMLEEVELSPKYEQPLAMAPSFRSEWLLAGELRQAGFVIPPLKYNQEEVEKLSDLSGGRFMTGEGATVANYKKYAKDYGLIHLATHAISSREDGLKSHVLLLDENGSPEPLYASEIGDETLNADLVVLSACETGGGLLHATEGTVGLTKAYLAAGARAVVASSWAVDDHATAELMDNFYEALSAGKRTDDALRDARAAYLQKHPETRPDKWAAFEAYGGMKAPGWDKSSNPFKGAWIWLLAGLGLLAGVLMVRKMKHA